MRVAFLYCFECSKRLADTKLAMVRTSAVLLVPVSTSATAAAAAAVDTAAAATAAATAATTPLYYANNYNY